MDQLERQIHLKTKSLERLNKDIELYTKELTTLETKLADLNTDENDIYNFKKQVIESKRTIEAVQIQMSSFLTQLEDNMAKFVALNADVGNDAVFVAQNATYQAACAFLLQLKTNFGLEINEALLIQ